ncbi:hypothetical protein AXA84_0448 [Candidatus Phytoplasma oryzae]|uniref:Uncharacterized protein n=1 Tax=Candidatus Phytoplasma oryzae TaxID=203274 RepID=A0A139JQ97_9MOLU|nr:hypothetical protein [Candidatus Phytoplasma oryzae]KXT29034.1 hypothetical protein AXA84_0448 [Candidatus Phytoplasma oryzae]
MEFDFQKLFKSFSSFILSYFKLVLKLFNFKDLGFFELIRTAVIVIVMAYLLGLLLRLLYVLKAFDPFIKLFCFLALIIFDLFALPFHFLKRKSLVKKNISSNKRQYTDYEKAVYWRKKYLDLLSRKRGNK